MKFITPRNLQRDKIRILMIGCGGTGGELIKLLVKTQIAITKLTPGRTGIELTLYDGDTVSESNIGRQNFYNGDVGYSKSELTIQRINYFHGFAWKSMNVYFDPNTINSVIHDYDLVLTCTDSATFRSTLGTKARECTSNVLWLDSGNGSTTGQCIIGNLCQTIGNSQRLPNILDLFPELDHTIDDDEPSCSLEAALAKQDLMINVLAATWMNNLIWQLIRHGGIDQHGVYFNLRKGITLPFKIDHKNWESLGYIE